ncbi:MAG: RraA family protein [Acidimicrobiaceae bacterium]|nr:RraA family protein [Acidimicrobiaceae bacterium]
MSLDPKEFAGHTTSALSDALDRLGVPGSAWGIRALGDGQRMVGRAFTVRYVPAGHPAGTVGDYIDDVEPGWVVVLDNDGRTDCTVWGDILTAVAANRGVAGTAINGVCRDTRRALDIHYPIYSAGRFMRTGKDRVEVAEMGSTVSLGDTQVRQGDILVGDDDGVVAIPAAYEEKVLEVANEIAEREGQILSEAIEKGSLREARAHYGYHLLQRRENAEG